MLHDAIVIGSDEDGISAAITAADAGRDVLLVDVLEADRSPRRMSGTMLLGLLHETILEIHAAHSVLKQERSASELRALFGRVLSQRREEALQFHISFLRERLARSGIGVASGLPKLISSNAVEIAPGDVRRAPVIVLSPGIRARMPARFAFDRRVVCHPDRVLLADSVPRSLLVIGADVAGCEFACMFAALGCRVTLVERRRRLLRFVDSDLREILHRWMQRMGVDVVLEEEIREIRRSGSGCEEHSTVVLESGRMEVSERILIVAGGVPNTRDLGLDRVGVATDERGFILVDDRWRTSQKGIWATGGAVDAQAPAAALGHQGRSAMLDALGANVVASGEIPLIIHTVPELAAVGLSQEACAHLDVRSFAASAPLGRVLRTRIRGEDEGLLKLVVHDETLRLLGVHVIGMGAHEVVNLGAALMRKEASLEDIAGTVFSSGSLSAAYRVAALEGLRHRGSRGAAMPGRRPTALRVGGGPADA